MNCFARVRSRMDATGVVVAGGRSTRFGDREKALAEVNGEPMLRRVVEALGTVTDEVVVNCRRDQRDAFAAALDGVDTGVRFALDEQPDEGPLVGLERALSAVGTDRAVVLGCDMPLADPAGLSAMLDGLGSEGDAVVPTTDGGPEPLHAVYRIGPALTAARAAIDDGERSLRALLARLAVEELPVGDEIPAQSVTSVDTAAALAAIETEE